jgi:hypothetical protein
LNLVNSNVWSCKKQGADRRAVKKEATYQQHSSCFGESNFDLSQRLLSQKARLSMLQENPFLKTWEVRMIRLIAFAAFAFAVTTSVQAMPLAPIQEPESMITQAVAGCGAGRTRVNGVCVARTTKRQARRCVRRGGGGACVQYQ